MKVTLRIADISVYRAKNHISGVVSAYVAINRIVISCSDTGAKKEICNMLYDLFALVNSAGTVTMKARGYSASWWLSFISVIGGLLSSTTCDVNIEFPKAGSQGVYVFMESNKVSSISRGTATSRLARSCEEVIYPSFKWAVYSMLLRSGVHLRGDYTGIKPNKLVPFSLTLGLEVNPQVLDYIESSKYGVDINTVELNKVFEIHKGNRKASYKIIQHPYVNDAIAVVHAHPYLKSGGVLPADISHIAGGCPAGFLLQAVEIAYNGT